MTDPRIPLSQSTHLSCTAGDDVVTMDFVVYSLVAPRTRHDRENNKRIPTYITIERPKSLPVLLH